MTWLNLQSDIAEEFSHIEFEPREANLRVTAPRLFRAREQEWLRDLREASPTVPCPYCSLPKPRKVRDHGGRCAECRKEYKKVWERTRGRTESRRLYQRAWEKRAREKLSKPLTTAA